jgi:hypothetical protein
MRKPISLVALLLVAAVLAPAAAADKPTKVPVPSDDFIIPPTICGFEVGVEILADKGKALIFDDGSMMITGSLKVRLTNLGAPTQSIALNIPGPGRFDESSLTATGPWLFFFLPGDLGPGTPAILAYTTGRVRVDDTGFHLLAGRRTDLCPLLAAG